MEAADYTEAKKQAGTALLSGAQQHDKAILTLAASALGLSLTFMKNSAPTTAPDTYWLLGFSWGCLIFAVVLTLASFQTSIHAFRRHDKILDLLYSGQESDPAKPKNHWTTATLTLSLLSLICFVAGIILLAIFSYVNLSREDCSMSERKPNSSEETRGAVPPSVPVSSGPPVNAGAVPAGPPVAQNPAPIPTPRPGPIPTQPPVSPPRPPKNQE